MPESIAYFSPDRLYRYYLRRQVSEALGTLNVIGLNPSVADETKNDPTIRRCIDFARRWGYGQLVVTNCFALVSTRPEALKVAWDAVGPQNDGWLRQMAVSADLVLAAWSGLARYQGRAQATAELLRDLPVYCLGVTRDGEPRHPLYMKATTQPQRLWE